MNVEVKNRRVDNIFLSEFLVMTGMVGVRKPGEQRLLPVPREEKKVERLGFDPVIEPRYLARFSGEMRRNQLITEMSTALEELLLSQYSHEYIFRDGKIIDGVTRIPADSLSSKNEYEVRAVSEVERQLAAGSKLIVNISPENKRFDYPDNMVDFWIKGEGERVTVLRLKADMDWDELSGFNSMVDGVNVSREEMLANPVAVNKYCLAELISFLGIAKSKDGLTVEAVEGVVEVLVKRFEREFGERVYVDSELITRMYVAARLEVENYEEMEMVPTKNFDIRSGRMRDYLYGELKTERKAGGGCGGSSLGGQFASEGIIIVNTADGISFRKGRTEGLKYCSRCGCWYSGEKCPICK